MKRRGLFANFFPVAARAVDSPRRSVPKDWSHLPPRDLIVPRGFLSDELREGDIVTLGAPGNPARDERTGIPVPTTLRFRVVGKAEEAE